MRKFLLAALLLITATCSATTNPKKESLKLGGDFLKEKVASYEVFEMDSLGRFVEVACEQNQHFFSVSLEVNKTYEVRFTSKSGVVKNLIVEVTEKGHFMLDVDFSTDKSARLVYDQEDERYEVRKLPKNEELYVRK